MRNWLRVVLPPAAVVVPFLLIYGLLEVSLLMAWFWRGVRPAENEAHYVGAVVVVIAAIAQGGFRVLGFHPLFRSRYRQWLKTTPWHVGQPLPAGPIHLTVQDAIILALMCTMVIDHGVSPWRIPFVFLISYLTFLVLTLPATGSWQQAYLVGFGLGLVVYLGRQPPAAVIAALAVYAVGYVGLLRSLARFPWNLSPEWDQFLTSSMGAQNLNEMLQPPQLGWPFDSVSPARPACGIGYADSVLVSLLLAWWTWVLISMPPSPRMQNAMMFIAVQLAIAGGLVRLGIYCSKHHAPISLWGRLWTGRWIVPRYDAVFVAPLVAAAMGTASTALQFWPVPAPFCGALGVFVTFLPLLAMGPSYERWHLTGGHRITPGRINKQQFIEH